MKAVKLMMVLGLGALVSACANIETATRNAPFETAAATPVSQPVAPSGEQAVDYARLMKITQINVDVPKSLTVSEANRYYPSGDIVWREDPLGDRHAQVKAIFEDAMLRGATTLTGSHEVVLDVTVARFHAVTEKARYTIGGVHSIEFVMQLRDAKTDEVIGAPHSVKADLDAFGGQQAITAESRGLTQKVRITAHLAEVLRQEMTKVGGFKNPKLGIIQAINQL